MEDAAALFHSSLETIRNTLSEQELASFRPSNNPRQMIAEIKLESIHYASHSKLVACCRKIAVFANAFAPYFDVVGVFVQIKPEWAGWFWGSIRLILQLGSNLTVCLDNVAKMFERIAFTLPQYQSWYEICRKNVRASDRDRLGHALSYIYSDMIQFCLHVHRIFSRSKRSSSLLNRAKFMSGMLWKPFQYHFADLLEKLQNHQAWFETEAMIQQHETITRHFDSFQDYLKFTEQRSEIKKRKDRSRQEKEYARYLHDIKEWISSPRYRDMYERTKRDRFPGSGRKFLANQRYVQWRNGRFHGNSCNVTPYSLKEHLERILFIQAKPGYGKTYLSGIIIDDLINSSQELVTNQDEVPSVVFYHFTSSNRWGSDNAEDALRSITSQLVNVHKADKHTIDAMILILSETGSGQRQASVEDIQTLLGLLLQLHPVYIVIDGIDECQDPDAFKRHILEISKPYDCRILLLGRPTIPFPSDCCLKLTEALNQEDIEHFLHENLKRLYTTGLLGFESWESSDLDKLATLAAKHANGMFLWARLLVNYLDCPALTPRERLQSLKQHSKFPGIENLYGQILKLVIKSGEKNAEVTSDIIGWLSGAMYPLNNDVLHTALAIVPGQRTGRLDYLVDYPDCISRITCALVETNEMGNLGFIHLSFREYLESRMGSANPLPIPSLHNWSVVHLRLAAKCMSYLSNDVPVKPLQPLQPMAGPFCGFLEEASATIVEASAAEQATVIKPNIIEVLRTRLPLLRYAALCWTAHLERAHAGNIYGLKYIGEAESTDHSQSWISILAGFLVGRRTVTTWVEACCIYQFLPRLHSLAKTLSYLSAHGSRKTTAGREILWMLNGISQLGSALEDLWGRHAEDLLQNPSLIWTERIKDTVEKDFWPNWEDKDDDFKGNRSDAEDSGQAGFQPDPGRVSAYHELEGFGHLYIR